MILTMLESNRLLLFALLAWLLLPVPSQAFTFRSPNIAIRLILEAAAREARVGLAIDPDVAGTLAAELVDVDALLAIRGIAEASRLDVRTVRTPGSPDSYVVSRGKPGTGGPDSPTPAGSAQPAHSP